MAYQMYRNTTLGITLQETLDELIQNGQITPPLALKVMTTFDRIINRSLSMKVRSKMQFKAGQLSTYRFCDNVWTFVMERVEFRDMSEVTFADRVKFVACDGRTSTGTTTAATPSTSK